MKKKIVFFIMMPFFFICAAINSQDLIDWDIGDFDSLFDDPSFIDVEVEEDASAATVLDTVKQRGFVFDASYNIQGGAAPGWDMRPWEFNGEEEFSWRPGYKMKADLSVDTRLSENFRVLTAINYGIPDFIFALGDFFFDYNISNRVFIRAGKYEHSWGIAGGFTNLLSRVPAGSPGGPSYIVKADVPIGVGGVQALALTRADISGGVEPESPDVGYGGKYNLALRWVDFDLGAFYQETMPTRMFLSAKTTVADTELYNEWMLAINTLENNEASFAVNLGFGRDFFNGKLSVGGEIFYNGEKDSYFYRPESNVLEAKAVPFSEAFGMTFNILYRFSGWGDPRFFLTVNFLPLEPSANVMPGFRIKLDSNAELYLAVPMSFGSKDSYHYINTADPFGRPFSILLYLNLKGSVQASYFY